MDGWLLHDADDSQELLVGLCLFSIYIFGQIYHSDLPGLVICTILVIFLGKKNPHT